MKENRQSALVLAAVTLMALAVPPIPAAAQTPAPAASPTAPANTRFQVTVVRLKPDMLNEWMDLQRNEVVPALKKAGVANRTVVSTVVGNSYEYTISTPFEKFAAMDGPGSLVTALGTEAAAQLNGKIRKCIATERSYMANRVNALTIPAGDAPVSRMVVRRVPQGKAQDYFAFYRTEVFPALKKAKEKGEIAGASISIRGAGAPANEIVTIENFNKFADLDGSNVVQAVIGREAYAALVSKSNALATNVQTVIRRRVADLSF